MRAGSKPLPASGLAVERTDAGGGHLRGAGDWRHDDRLRPSSVARPAEARRPDRPSARTPPRTSGGERDSDGPGTHPTVTVARIAWRALAPRVHVKRSRAGHAFSRANACSGSGRQRRRQARARRRSTPGARVAARASRPSAPASSRAIASPRPLPEAAAAARAGRSARTRARAVLARECPGRRPRPRARPGSRARARHAARASRAACAASAFSTSTAADLQHALLVAARRGAWLAGVDRQRVIRAAAARPANSRAQRPRAARASSIVLALDVHPAGVEPREVEQSVASFVSRSHLLAHRGEELAARALVELLVGRAARGSRRARTAASAARARRWR